MSLRFGQIQDTGRTATWEKWQRSLLLAALFTIAASPLAAQQPAQEVPTNPIVPAPPPVASPLPTAPAAAGPATVSTSDPAPSAVLDPLARARKQVKQYFDDFSDLTCKETVTQLVLNGSGRTIYRENSAFDYQFETTEQNGSWKFLETRESRSSAFRDPARTLLVTSGFASLLLVAHPMYEASYIFDSDGSESLGGISYERIRFKPIPGTSSPASLRLRGKNYPLPLSGTLWVDPQSGAIVKLEATVGSGLADVGLANLHSEIYFSQHQFRGQQVSVWVPESATIDVQTPHQHWRNLHRFTDYKRFDVNVHEEIGKNP